MRVFIIIFSSLFFSYTLHAQNANKWEIATDFLWLIDKNTLPKYSILVKRSISEKGKIRLRIGYDKNSSYAQLIKNEGGNKALLIRLGYEHTYQLSHPDFQIYFGLEGSYSYSTRIYSGYFDPVSQITELNRDDITKGGIVGVLGFRYLINESFSVSTESTVSVSRVGLKTLKRTNYQTSINEFLVSPISVLNFSFHF